VPEHEFLVHGRCAGVLWWKQDFVCLSVGSYEDRTLRWLGALLEVDLVLGSVCSALVVGAGQK
jgi:hypothetical protein